MRLGRNVIAGIANTAWSAIVALAVVPIYVEHLGIEAYGLIGFFVTTQALCQLLDLGMVPTITREIARTTASGDTGEGQRLLATLETVYWCVAGAIFLMITVLAPVVARYWLKSSYITHEALATAVTLIGLVVATRWPIGLYQGALMGAQRVVVNSAVNMVMTVLGSLGAVMILAFVSATIEAFFVWQAVVGLFYAGVIRLTARRILGVSKSGQFDWIALRRVWRFSAGMSIVATAGVIFAQLDKLILSNLLTLSEFGHYMLATVVVSALNAISMPFFSAVYPRFSSLVAGGNIAQLTNLYRLCTRVLATVLFPVAMLLVLFAKDLVTVWAGDAAIASTVAPVIGLLALGSALHGLMYMPYALQLAYGSTRLPILITMVLMTIFVPLIAFLTLTRGVEGAALAWLTLHVLYLMLGTWLTHRHFLKGIAGRWLLQDIGVPFGLTVAVGLLGSGIVQQCGLSGLGRLLSGITMTVVAIGASVLFVPTLRSMALGRLGWRRGENTKHSGAKDQC